MRMALAFLLAMALQSKPIPDDVPAFRLRARVMSIAGAPPDGKTFTFRWSVPGDPVQSKASDWSPPLAFASSQIEATLKGYPAMYLKGYPVVVHLQVQGVVDPTTVEAELTFEEGGDAVKLVGELFGPSLGILIWRDDRKTPQAATMAEYNRRYWKALEGVQIAPAERPKLLPIVDRFIGGDDDRRNWREGIEQLSRVGFNAIMLPPSRPQRDLLVQAGQRRTAWAVYNPPGYAFDHDGKSGPDAIASWAAQQSKPYLAAGYEAKDMAIFAMSDEPGWYYPKTYDALLANPTALDRFRNFLKDRGLTPADVGANDWTGVVPIQKTAAVDLPSRRLFYWTIRFFSWDSARHFAASTRALEAAFVPDIPVFTNWNFFSGRFYVPGPVANNPDKKSPDAAMGGHDWFEFGRMRGGTMLWTEDWFPDRKAYQWSFYAAKLNSAARLGNIRFGGYVIPRTAGDREDGIVQKILTVVGSGGKAIKYFVFGPEYTFPGNCYSERSRVLPKMAEAHRMIGAAEDLLWPGVRPVSPVAILAPRSAAAWDAREIPPPLQIQDATNSSLNGSTVDYMAEVFDLYLALQHAGIPVEFVDEDGLTAEGVRPYRVVYVTEPNVPTEGQRALAEWTRDGGTLVTVSGAAARDRYDEPCGVWSELTGLQEKARPRLFVGDVKMLKEVAQGTGDSGEFTAFGVRSTLEKTEDGVKARFGDGAPAVLERPAGKGRVVHFSWMPGMSYARAASWPKDRLPEGFPEPVRRWIAWPVERAGVQPPVRCDRPFVEAPLLLSDRGAALTLLNWTNGPLPAVKVEARVPFAVKRVESVKRGALEFQAGGNGVSFSLPLDAADIVLLRP